MRNIWGGVRILGGNIWAGKRGGKYGYGSNFMRLEWGKKGDFGMESGFEVLVDCRDFVSATHSLYMTKSAIFH